MRNRSVVQVLLGEQDENSGGSWMLQRPESKCIDVLLLRLLTPSAKHQLVQMLLHFLAGKSPGEAVALLLSSSDRALRSPMREDHHRPMAQGMEKRMSSPKAAPSGVYSNSRGRGWSTCVAMTYRRGMRCEVQHAKDCCMSIYESCIWHSLARGQMDSLQ